MNNGFSCLGNKKLLAKDARIKRVITVKSTAQRCCDKLKSFGVRARRPIMHSFLMLQKFLVTRQLEIEFMMSCNVHEFKDTNEDRQMI